MKPFRKIVTGLIGFDRRERRGTYVLSVFLIILLLVRLTAFSPGRVPEDLSEIALPDEVRPAVAEDEVTSRTLFSFDPNTVKYEDLLNLGLSERQAGTLIKYREAGAKFRRPEDLRRVYGIDSVTAARLIPYIVIVTRPGAMDATSGGKVQAVRSRNAMSAGAYRYARDNRARAGTAGSPESTSTRGGGEDLQGGGYQGTAETGMSGGGHQRTGETSGPGGELRNAAEKGDHYAKRPPRGMIDLNRCTAEELVSLPGIGPVLSERIVKYRSLLGGFVDKQQLKEVYGLDTAVVRLIVPMVTITLDSVKLMLLDSVSFGDLARHPYFGYEAARLITRFRTLTGAPLTLGAMVSRNVITPQQAERMAPYVRPPAEAAGNDYEFISSKVLK